MRPHVRCPRGSHKNRAGQCISTTPRRRIIRDVLPLPPYPPSPNFSSPSSSLSSNSHDSPFINMHPEDKNERFLYDVKQPVALAPVLAPEPLVHIRRKCPSGSRRDRRTGECKTTTPRRRIVQEPPARVTQRRGRLPRAAHNPAPAPARVPVRAPARAQAPPRAPVPARAPTPAPARTRRTLARALVPSIDKSQRRARCPPGYRRNPRTGVCDPTTRRGYQQPAPIMQPHMQPLIQPLIQPIQPLVHQQETPYNTNGVIEAYDAYMAGDSAINDPDVLNDPNVIVFYITNPNGNVINAVLGYRDRISQSIANGTGIIYKCRYADTTFGFYPEQALMNTPYFYLTLIQNHLLHLEEIIRIFASDNKFWLLRLTNEPIITSVINRKHINNRANPGYNLDGEQINISSGFHCQVQEAYLNKHQDPEHPKRIIADPIHGDQRLETWTLLAIAPSAI